MISAFARPENALRKTRIFAKGFNTFAESASLSKISLPFFIKICLYPPRPAPARGALRDRHECWARDAMDARACATSAAIADDEIVWSWRPWAGAKQAGDDPLVTVTMRSRTPGRARI